MILDALDIAKTVYYNMVLAAECVVRCWKITIPRGAYRKKNNYTMCVSQQVFSTPPFVRVGGVVLRRKKRFRRKDARNKLT